MPYISIHTSTTISIATEVVLKQELGKIIQTIPGKTEDWLMISFHGDEHLWFASSSDPCAMVEVKLFGGLSSECADTLTKKITHLLKEKLNIPPTRIYVRYETGLLWGWNGENF